MTATPNSVLVTGGSRGIGAACVVRLARAGYDVTFTYSASERRARQLEASLRAENYRAAALRCDLASPAQSEALAEQFLTGGRLPFGIVCCAGAALDSLSTLTDMDAAHRLFQLNFFCCVQLIKAFARPLARQGAGRIVLMGSVASERGARGNAVYSATKGALQSYMRSVVEEFAKHGVTINCVRPGFVATEMIASCEPIAPQIAKRIPAGRFGRADEIAAVVEFLLSPGAAYLNGATLDVDGGLSATVGGIR